MHDVVAPGGSGHRVVRFNAGSDVAQASRLRLVNAGAEAVAVRIEGIDDAGVSSGGAVEVTVPARGARTLGAAQLESGEGLAGALGTGTGRWRLLVSAERPIEVMSLIASASGHLVNVSTARGAVGSGESGASTVHRVAWLPAAARWAHGGVRGLVRIVNHSRDAGAVRIEAFDDTGVAAPPVSVALGGREAVEFTSAELEGGAVAKGLSGGHRCGRGGLVAAHRDEPRCRGARLRADAGRGGEQCARRGAARRGQAPGGGCSRLRASRAGRVGFASSTRGRRPRRCASRASTMRGRPRPAR